MAWIPPVKANPYSFKYMLFAKRILAALVVVLCVAVGHVLLHPRAQAAIRPCSASLTCCNACGCERLRCSGASICYAIVGEGMLVCDGVEYYCPSPINYA